MDQSNESTVFAVGDVLATKDGEVRTNAIIIGEGVVLTDFGNILKIDMWDIWRYYTLSENYLIAKKTGYPLPSVSERIEEQLALLIQAQEIVNGM